MLYGEKRIYNHGGLLKGYSLVETADILDVSRQTLLSWIAYKIINPDKVTIHNINGRIHLEFDRKEVSRVDSLIKKNREKGKPIISAE